MMAETSTKLSTWWRWTFMKDKVNELTNADVLTINLSKTKMLLSTFMSTFWRKLHIGDGNAVVGSIQYTIYCLLLLDSKDITILGKAKISLWQNIERIIGRVEFQLCPFFGLFWTILTNFKFTKARLFDYIWLL